MKSIDVYTLVYIITAISFVFGALMLLFVKMTPQIKGPLYWSLGSILVGLGAFLFSINSISSTYLSFAVSGTFSMAGPSLYIAGLQAFKGKRINRLIFPGLLIVQFIAGSFFVLVYPNPIIRMTIFSILFGVMSAFAVYEFLLPYEKPYKIAFRLGAFTFMLSVISSFSRVFIVLFAQPETIQEITNANRLIYFFGNAQQAIFLFVFMLMISIRLTESLNQRIRDQHRFFSIIGHDLNSPVGTISEMLSLINNEDELPEESKVTLLNEAEKLGRSTYLLLQNLLYWGKNQLDDLKPKFSVVDINHVINENISLLERVAKLKSVTINFHPCESATCMVDEHMISTILRNLISNSIKFSNPGSEITITCTQNINTFRVSVKDQGIGMDEDTLSKLFSEDKDSRKPGTAGERGTGLGLLLCKNFINKNKGTIDVKSELNKGTEISINLPISN